MSPIQRLTLVGGLGLGVACMIFFVATKVYLAQLGHNAGIKHDALSNSIAVGFPTDDREKIGLLQELYSTPLGQLDPDETPKLILLGEHHDKSGDGVPIKHDADEFEQSPLYDLVRAKPRYLNLVTGSSVDSIWNVAPLVVVADEESLLATSFCQYGERNPGALDVAVRAKADSSSEDDDGAGSADGPAQSLLSFVWFSEHELLPKLERLARERRYFQAKRTADAIRVSLGCFKVDSFAVEKSMMKRINALYLAILLFENPDLNLKLRDQIVDAIQDLRRWPMSDDNLSDIGPPIYRKAVGMGEQIRAHQWSAEDESGVADLPLHSFDRDLLTLMLVRGRFWRAKDSLRWPLK